MCHQWQLVNDYVNNFTIKFEWVTSPYYPNVKSDIRFTIACYFTIWRPNIIFSLEYHVNYEVSGINFKLFWSFWCLISHLVVRQNPHIKYLWSRTTWVLQLRMSLEITLFPLKVKNIKKDVWKLYKIFHNGGQLYSFCNGGLGALWLYTSPKRRDETWQKFQSVKILSWI